MAGTDIQQRLLAAKRVITDPRLRTLAGKKKMLVEDGNVYGERMEEEEFDRFLDGVYADEATRKIVLAELDETPLSVEELSERTSVKPEVMFRHLLVLQQKGYVEVERVENDAPLYRSTGLE